MYSTFGLFSLVLLIVMPKLVD